MCVVMRVRGEIMGSRQKYEHVGESRSLLIMDDPMISTRARMRLRRAAVCAVRIHAVGTQRQRADSAQMASEVRRD